MAKNNAAGLAQVMAIVNRTPDSFYDNGATFAIEKAAERADAVIAAGASIVDVGGVKAGPGDDVDAREESDRVVSPMTIPEPWSSMMPWPMLAAG